MHPAFVNCTLIRQAVDLLTVTDFSVDAATLQQRKVAVISGRVHPGETNASWMMQALSTY